MKFGFIGSGYRIRLIKQILSDRFPEMEKQIIINDCHEYQDFFAKELRESSKEWDGCFFCGRLQYELYKDLFRDCIPCAYFHKDDSSLKTAMLSLSSQNISLEKISIDNYTYGLVKEIYRECNISLEQVHILKRDNFRLNNEIYYQSLIRQHTDLYCDGKTRGAITTLSFVYDELIKRRIPCSYVVPTYDSIVREIHTMIQVCETGIKKADTQLCCILFQLNPDFYGNLLGQNTYTYSQSKLRAMEEINYFAKNLDALVIPHSDEDFTVICQMDKLMEYTKELHTFPVLQIIRDNCSLSFSVGIGLGSTPVEAGYHAKLAKKKALREETDGIFICHNVRNIIGPMEYVDLDKKSGQKQIEHLDDISAKTGVSSGKLRKLLLIAARSEDYTVTVKSLAEEMELSVRAANRLLNRLEEYQLVEAIGKSIPDKAGRPANIFRVLLR